MNDYKYSLKDAKKAFENFTPNKKDKKIEKKRYILIGFIHGFELIGINK